MDTFTWSKGKRERACGFQQPLVWLRSDCQYKSALIVPGRLACCPNTSCTIVPKLVAPRLVISSDELPLVSQEVAALIKQTGYQPRPAQLAPSLHEIRSLSARLWAEQHGHAFAQSLLGHKSPEMTALYGDVRGAEWITVRVG